MKNIIYTIVDEKFYKFFKYFYYSLKKINSNTDLLCITPENLNIKLAGVIQFKLKDFDSKYSAKYKIVEWSEFESYNNYLYLDCDIYFLRDPDSIFLEIENEKFKIHGIKEDESLNKADYHHNFNKTVFKTDCACFNAGSFGFNKTFKNKIIEFLSYIEINKDNAWTEQPLFNIFFYNLITENLNKHIEIFEKVKPINPKIIHLSGFPYQVKLKENVYKKFFRKESRGDILFLLPQKSNVGLFNCADYFENQSIKYIQETGKKEISVFKNNYTVNNEFYDYIYIDSASSINELVDIIRKIYPKVKGGGIISSVMAGETGKNILKNFITKSGLDFFQCYEDDVFFTIKL